MKRSVRNEMDMDGDAGTLEAQQYRWEQGAGESWEQVREDAQGNIISLTADRARSNRAKQQRVTQSIRRGLIRYLVVCLDCSSSSAEKDYRPCRLETAKVTTPSLLATSIRSISSLLSPVFPLCRRARSSSCASISTKTPSRS